MLAKALTLIGLMLALWGLFRRASAVLGSGSPEPARVTDMVRCTACGAFHERGRPCGCAEPPTP
jgi:hypothetical protein